MAARKKTRAVAKKAAAVKRRQQGEPRKPGVKRSSDKLFQALRKKTTGSAKRQLRLEVKDGDDA